ncbi:hypothetical protein [Bradyrhizobium sp. G127]|uniref:hypothetical protein n=1 Tax=Bradyrhizobium sp. G127 TaxID=2904800 RepID=UPI001F283654|nr:hypothetical protein [Bradyrhizobium sp. G127]MCF2522242.1 hypothetical protein [Bradyrhizobium sp. G127]
MINNTSAELREWAARCEDAAASAPDDHERASLLRKCDALRALADSEDWLAGQSVDTGSASANRPVFPDANRAQAAE